MDEPPPSTWLPTSGATPSSSRRRRGPGTATTIALVVGLVAIAFVAFLGIRALTNDDTADLSDQMRSAVCSEQSSQCEHISGFRDYQLGIAIETDLSGSTEPAYGRTYCTLLAGADIDFQGNDVYVLDAAGGELARCR